MKFLEDVKSSLYNPTFFASLRGRTLRSSFKYFFLLVAVLAFTLAFEMGAEFSPLFTTESLRQFANYYPEELTLTLKGGVISSNVIEPYFIKAPVNFVLNTGHVNLAVIDTKNDFSLDLLKKYDADFFIGKNVLVSLKSEGQFQATETVGMPDFTLNQTRLLHWADVIGGRHFWLSLGLFAALFSFFYGFFTLKLLWLVLVTLVVMLIGKFKQMSFSFKNAFQIAVHAATIPLVTVAIFMMNGLNEPFLFFFTLILLVIVFVNVKSHYTTVLEP